MRLELFSRQKKNCAEGLLPPAQSLNLVNQSMLDDERLELVLSRMIQQVIDDLGHITDGNVGVLIHVGCIQVETSVNAVQQIVDEIGHVVDGNLAVVVYITQGELGIGRSYPVTNGEGDRIVEEPVPVIVVGEVG